MPALRKTLPAALGAALLIASAAAWSQTRVVPADPVQFERVSLRQTVDDCTFDPDRVRVTLDAGVIHVEQPPRQCFAPGNPAVVDIQLGAFPAGDYRVEIHSSLDQPAEARVDFTVYGVGQAAVFPAPPMPLVNYTGIWWKSAESGWGLSLHQGVVNTLVGAVYIFGADQQPQWYTLGSGQWVSSTKWTGELIRSNGPSWSSAVYDRQIVKHTAVGTATLDFGMTPGNEDVAEFTYTIDGETVSKTISRIRF
jgi:hypothetical protein